MAAHDPDRRVDELRQQLRSLGYLDAGVDRFVLGAARESRTPAAIGALASIRIGAIAAVLTGPAAAIGVASRMPGLITGARDGFVVAAYMGVLFGLGVAVAAFVATLIAAWIARRGTAHAPRRRRRAAVAAGAMITAACLAYLTLWWDASTLGGPSGGWNTFWTAFGLALAAAISLLLGHLVTVAALAVTVARTPIEGEVHGVPGTSRGVIAIAGLLAFLGALLLFTLTHQTQAAVAGTSGLTVVPTGLRVRLLAIDGFDPEVARRLALAGRIPYFARALKLAATESREPMSGAVARAAIRVDSSRDPVPLWTTIATGQPPSVHAVRGLETRRVLGVQGTLATGAQPSLERVLGATTDLLQLTRPAIASGTERRAKTVWEIASGAGLRTVVINWWATWPAPDDAGIVVSDRALVRLEQGGELDAEIAPRALYERLRETWPGMRIAASQRAERIPRNDEIGRILRRSAELDALQLTLTRDLPGPTTDLVCTYLSGLDIAQHALLTMPAMSASTMAERLEALEEYYVHLDSLLREIEGTPPDRSAWLVALLTMPGRVEAGTPGVLAFSGDPANPRTTDAIAQPGDIMPTLLHALGVPISGELRGRVLVELFSPDFARRYPIRTVNSYGPPAITPTPRGGKPLDQEMIDRLRSLGYVR